MNPINTVQFSLHPTEFFSVKKLVNVNDLDKTVDLWTGNVRDGMVEVYVNPSVLSYTLIDNILNLQERLNKLQLTMHKFEQPLKDEDIYTSKLAGDYEQLLQLNNLNLYEAKFEEGRYRGGQRFLFRCDALKEQLNRSLQCSLPDRLLRNFRTVNNVFRYNHFAPEDNDFHEHYDIPYVDMHNMLISRYTLLVYLTPGENNKSVLSIAGK